MYIPKLFKELSSLILLLMLGSCMGSAEFKTRAAINSNNTQNSDRSLLMIEESLQSLTSDVSCDSANDCTWVHYERSGCAYAHKEIIYSKSANQEQVLALASEYDRIFSKQNSNSVGICAVRPSPDLYCINSGCTDIMPDQ